MPKGIYLLCLLDLTDLLSSSRVVGGKDLPTYRILPLIVNENLQEEKYSFGILVNKCKHRAWAMNVSPCTWFLNAQLHFSDWLYLTTKQLCWFGVERKPYFFLTRIVICMFCLAIISYHHVGCSDMLVVEAVKDQQLSRSGPSSSRLLCKGYGRISGNLDRDSCLSSIALWGVLHHPDKGGG